MAKKAFIIKISGRVTGVGFRWATLDKSGEFASISGYIRNVGSGKVEVFLQGEENEVDAMIEWLATGPPFARVDTLEKAECPFVNDLNDFEIR